MTLHTIALHIDGITVPVTLINGRDLEIGRATLNGRVVPIPESLVRSHLCACCLRCCELVEGKNGACGPCRNDECWICSSENPAREVA